MPALGVPLPNSAGGDLVPAEQRVDERGLARPRLPHQHRGAAGHERPDVVEPDALLRGGHEDAHARMLELEPGQVHVDGARGAGLGQQEDGVGVGVPGLGGCPVDPTGPDGAIQAAGDQHELDVGGQGLGPGAVRGHPAHQGRALQDPLESEVVRVGVGWAADGQPVADRGRWVEPGWDAQRAQPIRGRGEQGCPVVPDDAGRMGSGGQLPDAGGGPSVGFKISAGRVGQRRNPHRDPPGTAARPPMSAGRRRWSGSVEGRVMRECGHGVPPSRLDVALTTVAKWPAVGKTSGTSD